MTNTGLGKGIEEAMKDVLSIPTDENQQTPYDDPETCEQIRRIYDYLSPQIVRLQWWGQYCTAPEKLAEVMQLYKEHPNLMHYPGIIDLGPEKGVVHNKKHWSYHVLEAIKKKTERWNQLSAEGQRQVIENCRRQELMYMYGCNGAAGACHPIIPPKKYAEFESRIKDWDGRTESLAKIKQELDIDDEKKYRYCGSWEDQENES